MLGERAERGFCWRSGGSGKQKWAGCVIYYSVDFVVLAVFTYEFLANIVMLGVNLM